MRSKGVISCVCVGMGPYYTFRLIFSLNTCSVTVQLAKSRRDEVIKMSLCASDLPSVISVRSEELDKATKHRALCSQHANLR